MCGVFLYKLNLIFCRHSSTSLSTTGEHACMHACIYCLTSFSFLSLVFSHQCALCFHCHYLSCSSIPIALYISFRCCCCCFQFSFALSFCLHVYFIYSALARLLLLRALQSPRVALDLFWQFRPEMEMHGYGDRFSLMTECLLNTCGERIRKVMTPCYVIMLSLYRVFISPLVLLLLYFK